MTLKSITALKFVVKPTFNRYMTQDPVIARRSHFVVGLNKQLDLLNGKEGTEKQKAWFKPALLSADGEPKGASLVASVRYRNSPIKLEGANAFFEVPSKTALITIYKAIAKEVDAGEWDAILETKSKSMKTGGRRKPLAQAA